MELFEDIKAISNNYLSLKGKFVIFHDLASKYCRQEEIGLVFEPQLEKDIFDVKFAGKYVRFRFSIYMEEKAAYGLVEVTTMNPRTLVPLEDIGEFKLQNVAGNTEMIFGTESKGQIDDLSAPKVIYHFLGESLIRRQN